MKFSAALFLASSLFAGSVHGQTTWTLPTNCQLVPGTAGTYYCKEDDSLLTWAAAKAEAETLNFECPTGQDVVGRLAIPTTAAEADLMLKTTPNNYNGRWVGAEQTACTAEAACSWSWLDGQQLPGTSDLWEYFPEPNDNNGGNNPGADCGFVKDDNDSTLLGFLRDGKCTNEKKYIVEYDCNDLYATAPPGGLDISNFNLNKPTIEKMEIAIATTSGSAETLTPGTTSDALNQLSVEFDHGPGSNNGATGILLTAGFCPDGDELLDLSNTDGLTDTTTTVSCTGTGPTAGPTACESTYEIGFDLTTTTLDLDEDGKLYFCVTHFFEHETGAVLDASGDEVTAATDVVLNFQQTDVTVTFDLVTESIIGFIFQTAKSSPDLEGITLDEILAEAIEISEPSTPVDPNDSNSPKYYVQGQLMSWDICPIDPSEMFRTAALVSLKAEGTRDGNDPQFQQYLTTASGATQDAIFAQIFQSTVNPDCLNIQFILQSDFFAIFETVGDNAAGPLPVQVSGTVRFTEKTERRTLRAENESRQLQTRVTESDVEMNMVLGVTADANSGSYLVSVSSFTLLGAAGAALLI